jgi:hypothetical protein
MKKLALGLFIAIVFMYIIYFFLNNPRQTESSFSLAKQVSILDISGDSIVFNNENYPNKIIVNFYGTKCGLCLTEINDIVSFSRKTSTKVLFITADSIPSIKSFIAELERQNITDEQIMFAKISLQSAIRLFGDLTVPQTLLVDENFRIIGSKKGIVSYSFLKRSFE